MELLKKHITEQIKTSQGKNLFNDNYQPIFNFLALSPELIKRVQNLDKAAEEELLDFVSQKTALEFGKVNQYYSFDSNSLTMLRKIYIQLLGEIKALGISHTQEGMNATKEKHFYRLRTWLSITNGFAKEIFQNQGDELENIPCSEYSAQLQIQLLGIETSKIKSPLLDIGCGIEGRLVKYFRSLNIEAYGIDRFAETDSILQKADWLEYEYKSKSWGTIISNLGFSNHFNHHHSRINGNYLEYANKYMEILESLKIHGTFYYAPGLSFIEQYLDENKYKVEKFDISGTNFYSAKIRCLE